MKAKRFMQGFCAFAAFSLCADDAAKDLSLRLVGTGGKDKTIKTAVFLQVGEIFSDSMVLQHGVEVPVFGKALPDAKIKISFADQTSVCTADKKGNWQTVLKPLAISSVPQKLTISSDKDEIVLNDILVGDVWHVSGQSNMETSAESKLREYNERKEFYGKQADVFRKNIAENIATLQEDMIRFVTVRPEKLQWLKCVGNDALPCPLAALYFALKIRKELNIPIGIVNTSYGCASIETYIPLEALEKAGFNELAAEGRELQEHLAKGGINAMNAEEKHQFLLAHCRHPKYQFCRALADKDGNIDPKRYSLINWHMSVVKAGAVFNSIFPKINAFPVRGMLWYQGCTNLPDNYYAELQKLFVESMRRMYKNPSMPFYFVMIAPHPFGTPLGDFYIQQYEAAVNTSNSFLVATADTPPIEQADYHPSTKDFIGERLALAALKNTYGKNFPDAGPIFDGAIADGGTITVKFRCGEGLKTTDGEAPKLFEIAGADRKFYPADAKIANDCVVLSASEVTSPVYARYCWSNTHNGANIVNKYGLPVFPFDSSAEFFAKGKCRELKF